MTGPLRRLPDPTLPDDLRYAIGVDLGGTKIAFALVDSTGFAHEQFRVPTGVEEGTGMVLDRIAAGIRQLIMEGGQPVSGIGIGAPGLIDPQTGIVHYAVNLNWREVALRDEIARRLGDLGAGLPIHVQRDTNAGTVGEHLFGAGRGVRDFVLFAVGTGLGMGALSDKRLVSGAQAMAMEMGHVGLYPGGRQCGCGLRGCPEMYASGVGVMASLCEFAPEYPASALAQTPDATTANILAAAAHDDPLALKIVETAAEALAAMMTMSVVALNPALIVIGGGLGLALYDRIQPMIAQRVQARTLPMMNEGLRFASSQIRSSAVGAAALVWYQE